MTRSSLVDRTDDTQVSDRRQGPPPKRGSGGKGPERVTVNLIPRASQALHEVSDLTGDSKTDTINRALQVYKYLMEIVESGGDIYVREKDSEQFQLVKMF
jgi:hypothetical protein